MAQAMLSRIRFSVNVVIDLHIFFTIRKKSATLQYIAHLRHISISYPPHAPRGIADDSWAASLFAYGVTLNMSPLISTRPASQCSFAAHKTIFPCRMRDTSRRNPSERVCTMLVTAIDAVRATLRVLFLSRWCCVPVENPVRRRDNCWACG